ncbi:MAG: tetratricopeptide repeat protein [Planctomycetaceae bacterium]
MQEPGRPTSLPTKPSRATRRAPRVLRTLGIILGFTALLLGGYLWLAERPLRGVERALTQRNFPFALRQIDAFLKANPTSSRALDLKAQALVGLKRHREALALYERVGTDTQPGQRAWSEALLQEKRWSDALPLLTSLNRQLPDDPDILHELAACSMQTGDFDAAISHAAHLARLPEQAARGGLLLGVLHANHGNHRKAADAFSTLLHDNPRGEGLQILPEELFQGLGQALLGAGQAKPAIAGLEQAIAARPTAERHALLGDACELAGELDRARLAWEASLALDPAEARAREGLARLALDERQPARVSELLTPVAEDDRLTSTMAHLLKRASQQLGQATEVDRWDAVETRLRDSEERRRALEDLVRQSPKSFWAIAVRSHRFASEGNLYQALILADALLDIRKQKPDSYPDPDQFVDQLLAALQHGEPLPSLDLIPLARK